MSLLTVITKVLGSLRTNCFLIYNVQSHEAVIIDPADNAVSIQAACEQNHLHPVAVLLTHGHFDHIMAAEDMQKIYEIPICAGFAEKTLLSDAALNGGAMLNKSITLTADQWLHDGARLDWAGFQIEVLATPGHTPGSVCYYIKDEQTLFSGDTLFRKSFGRTDFHLGDSEAIYHSITQKLFALPGDTVVYPGHGVKTTIAFEKQNNMIYSMATIMPCQ